MIGTITFADLLQRKLAFHLNNNIFTNVGHENSERGERDALERMLADSSRLTESQFESKYLAELEELKARASSKPFSIADGDDYYESYNNAVVGILALLNPIHLYDCR
ncbi:MAG: hypothetical protein ABI557_16220 [Aureliella sp.]